VASQPRTTGHFALAVGIFSKSFASVVIKSFVSFASD